MITLLTNAEKKLDCTTILSDNSQG